MSPKDMITVYRNQAFAKMGNSWQQYLGRYDFLKVSIDAWLAGHVVTIVCQRSWIRYSHDVVVGL